MPARRPYYLHPGELPQLPYKPRIAWRDRKRHIHDCGQASRKLSAATRKIKRLAALRGVS